MDAADTGNMDTYRHGHYEHTDSDFHFHTHRKRDGDPDHYVDGHLIRHTNTATHVHTSPYSHLYGHECACEHPDPD